MPNYNILQYSWESWDCTWLPINHGARKQRTVDKRMDLNECGAKCLENCSCMAYATLDIKQPRRCAIWLTALSGIERGRIEERQNYNMELQLFELDVILKANNNFSSKKKLGDGSFGPIYKGTLLDRKDIAVKRLSGSFVQGLVEFKNEVALISKLQYWNLVKLL
ncbi:hypothetical protein SLEP1_g57273 [Rubroshorea leprosula]|uniref:Uncharacterized protein n=1 Tax=Rubroshorea leprosula TaxID=152421 RepID=A0AAV5MKQ9_9ROSI|nr:hypothetical protein SLEP1_g57273 [Rubroshorea leprosula]